MGHLASKEAYRRLRSKLDRFPVGTPGSETILQILETVFSKEDAELAAQVPFRFTTLGALSRKTGIPEKELRPRLESLADRGLVFDFELGGKTRYMLTPTMVGFFEFSMMRLREDIDQRHLSELLHRYIIQEPEFFHQLGDHATTTPFRAVAHEPTMPEDYAEILDWERASHVVGDSNKWGLGLCHCRHVAHHRGHECEKIRMDICLSLGTGADYLIRHGLAREIERAEAMDIMEETREAGLVHIVDNVQRNPTFLCNCCGCCCELLVGYKKFGDIPNTFSSNFQATVTDDACTGCGKCAKACPVDAIYMRAEAHTVNGKTYKKLAAVAEDTCIGCGVCVPTCSFDALAMEPRAQRRVTPEGAFSRVLSMALEQGKLQNLLVDPDDGPVARAANLFLGAFLRLPPTKQLLARDSLKSRFLDFILGSAKKGKMAGSDM